MASLDTDPNYRRSLGSVWSPMRIQILIYTNVCDGSILKRTRIHSTDTGTVYFMWIPMQISINGNLNLILMNLGNKNYFFVGLPIRTNGFKIMSLTYFEQFHKVVELAVHVSTDSHRTFYLDNT